MSALPPRQVPRKRITRARPCCLRLEEGYGRDSSSVNKGAQRERGPPRELRAPVQASLLSVRRATLLGVVALLAACHRGGGHHETSPLRLGQPAKENPFAKGVFVCPGGYDWPAYGDVVYAPSDSRIPAADVRPKRCFASLDEAQRANFHLAPPPPGGVLIDTIYLVPPEPPSWGPAGKRLADYGRRSFAPPSSRSPHRSRSAGRTTAYSRGRSSCLSPSPDLPGTSVSRTRMPTTCSS